MKLIDQLIRKKAKLAWRSMQVGIELNELIEVRYSTNPGEIDCDPAIDALDYGLSPDYTLADLDKDMTECGSPPIQLPNSNE